MSKYIIFDLDDTLTLERDYLESAYLEIAKILEPTNSLMLFERMIIEYESGLNVFKNLTKIYKKTSLDFLLEVYRTHNPKINLEPGIQEVLDFCLDSKYKLGVITDGRSLTQRNKLRALQLESIFSKIVISEEIGSSKPNENNYKVFIESGIENYFYIGDNVRKDFLTPNRLGWTTICVLDKGRNIHSQDFSLGEEYLPKIKVSNALEIIRFLNK